MKNIFNSSGFIVLSLTPKQNFWLKSRLVWTDTIEQNNCRFLNKFCHKAHLSQCHFTFSSIKNYHAFFAIANFYIFSNGIHLIFLFYTLNSFCNNLMNKISKSISRPRHILVFELFYRFNFYASEKLVKSKCVKLNLTNVNKSSKIIKSDVRWNWQ